MKKMNQSVVGVELSLCCMDGMSEKGKAGIKTNFGAVETDKASEKYTQNETTERDGGGEPERERKPKISSDLCILKDFYIVARTEIPQHGFTFINARHQPNIA